MSKGHILVVEDEPDIAEVLRVNLERDGFEVTQVKDTASALRKLSSSEIELVLLDVRLPDGDGFEVLGAIRGNPRTAEIPVIVLTARSEEADVLRGFELRADDYVTKPFMPRVVVARVRALMRRRKRRPQEAARDVVKIEGLEIDPVRHQAVANGEILNLTLSEFRILHLLTLHAGQVFSRQQIVDAVHGPDYPVTERSIDVQIVNLRQKIGELRNRLETVRGVGYRFRD